MGICEVLVKSSTELEVRDVDVLKDDILFNTDLLQHYTVPGMPSLKSKMLQSPLQAQASLRVCEDRIQWIDVTILAAAAGLRLGLIPTIHPHHQFSSSLNLGSILEVLICFSGWIIQTFMLQKSESVFFLTQLSQGYSIAYSQLSLKMEASETTQ